METTKKKNLPIGGWLIIIGIGLLLTSIGSALIFYSSFTTYAQYDFSNIGDLETNYAKILYEFIMLFMVVLFFSSLAVQYFFWKKRKEFVYIYILYSTVVILFTLFNEILININEYRWYYTTMGISINSLITISYLFISNRVKNTFVNEKTKYIKLSSDEYENLKNSTDRPL